MPQTRSAVATSNSTADVHSSFAKREQEADHVFSYANGSYRYLGGRSGLAAAIDILEDRDLKELSVPPVDLELMLDETKIRPHIYAHMGQIYLTKIEPFFPLLDDSLRDLVLTPLANSSTSLQKFILFMIYSISCQLMRSPNEHRWLSLGECFRKQAMSLLEVCTSEPTISTLRVILLLAIYTLIEPKEGNIGQQIALASRLAIDLASHDLNRENAASLQQMYTVIFCLENEVATSLDRPTTFPEPVRRYELL
jgi:hypothetical protein